MLLSQLTASAKDITLSGSDVNIIGLSEDSRKVKPGFLFVATPGIKQDGRDFIGDALAKGAVAILAPHGTPQMSVPILTTPNIRQATSALAATFYPHQPKTIAAVTGTSGKTSTAQFTREIWQALGYRSASIGTLGVVTKDDAKYGALTTPDALTLHQALNACATDGITHLAIEASSHGIELNRLDHVKLKAGGFTNLSRDHLDYHHTMEAYLAAKMRLFSELLPAYAPAVLNADIAEFPALVAACTYRGLPILSYGKSGKDLKLINIRPDARGQILELEVFGKKTEILLPVMGDFQAANVLCAAGLVIGCGADADATLAAIAKVSGVPGRLQFVGTSNQGGAVFVDYAHKPDALENVLSAMRPHVAAHHGKLGVIFGCGGNRDKGKRPLMGGIAQRKADWVIVTDDNPRHEEPTTIRAEILAGCRDQTNVREMGDRAQAIAEGIKRLSHHDVLIIAGKGHEPGQIVGDKVLPFDDTEEARKVLGL